MFRGAIVLLAFFATTAAAQPPAKAPPKYVRFPIDGNPEQMLADFLKTKAGQDLFQQLLKDNWQDLLQQPPENLEKLLRDKGKSDPALKRLIEFLQDHPGLKDGNPAAVEELLKQFGGDLQGNEALADIIRKGLEQKLGRDGLPKMPEFDPPGVDNLPEVHLPKFDEMLDDEFSLEDRFGEWLNDFLKDENVQNDLANFLRDSPDLQEAFGDLARSLQGQGANGNWMPKLPDVGAGKWNLDLKPPKMPFELGKLPKLPNIQMPKLPQFNLPMPKLGGFGLPRLPGFGGIGRMPGAPNTSVGSEWAYILLALVALGMLWWFLRKVDWTSRSRTNPAAALLAGLPGAFTTRSQLREAFDALALARLGAKALPWNHRHIARLLADAPESTVAANAFANLYEMARYTPGDDLLTRAEQEAARASLVVLAGGAA